MQIDKEIQVRICPYCGYNKNEISQQACVDCGQILPLTARIVTRVIKVETESPGFSLGMQTDREVHALVCTYCNASNPSWGSFCAYCGQPLSKFCPGCGAENPSWGSFCTSCGGHPPLGAQRRVVRVGVEYAGFWRRSAAYILDCIILIVLQIPVTIMFVSLPYFYYYYFGSLLSTVYFVGFWTWKSRTLGNMALGVRIVTEAGEPISFGRALVRYFGYIVCWIAPLGFGLLAFLNFLSLGFWWIGWDKRKQGWHDKLANTFVVKN